MLIAKEINEEYVISDYRDMFPNTSFPSNGPSEEWMVLNGCYPVNQFKEHDPETQMLVQTKPYLENGFVYTIKVEDKTS
jgi:hypothetical protein